MKNLFIIFFLFLHVGLFGQSVYYFSNSGNDSNSGTSINLPFRSLNKLNQLILRPGDKVLFHCNETFTGQVDIRNSGTKTAPIEISSYGTGKKPIISGAKRVTDWQKISANSNIWEAPCAKDSVVTDFFSDSHRLPLGRFPNNGYLTVASHAGVSSIVAKEDIHENWQNAELVFKPNEYIIEKPKITSQNGKTFTILNEHFPAHDDWGFFIQNSLATLHFDGQWCFNVEEKKIYFYDDVNDPNKKNLQIAYFSRGINLINSNYITIKNIEIDRVANTGVYAYRASNVLLSDVTIDYSGDDGIIILGDCENISLDHDIVNHCNNDGVRVWYAQNFTFTNNIIKNCGTVPGRGKADNGAYLGFQYISKTGNAKIENNIIDSIGYNGLEFESPNVLISQNLVSHFCTIKSDGGGIYTFNGRRQSNYSNIKIINNIIIGCKGDSISINHRPHINGIYMDDCSTNAQIIKNTVINCEQAGIYLHGTINILVNGNTLYDNGIQYYNSYGECDSRGNVIDNNIFVNLRKNQMAALHLTHDNDETIGNFSNNIYISPDVNRIITVMPNQNDQSQTKRVSLDKWKSMFRKDNLSSTIDNSNVTTEIKYNIEKEPKTIILNGNYSDIYGHSLDRKITLQPFTSIVLLKRN